MTDNQTTQQPAPKMTGGERVRLFRNRKAKDILLVEIQLLPTERDRLIKLGFLHKSRRSDKKAAVDAIYAFLEKHLDPPQVWPLGSWESNGSVGNG